MGKSHGTGALKPDKRYSLADWRSWPDEERWELIDGAVYNMTPSPNVGHQEKSFDLGLRRFCACPRVSPRNANLECGSIWLFLDLWIGFFSNLSYLPLRVQNKHLKYATTKK